MKGMIILTKKKGKRIGQMTNSRLMWAINPVTRKTENKKAYKRKTKHKGKGDYAC